MTDLSNFSGQCLKCRYALRGLIENRCPECGQSFDPTDPTTWLDRSRRSSTWSYFRWLMTRKPSRRVQHIYVVSAILWLWGGSMFLGGFYVMIAGLYLMLAMTAWRLIDVIFRTISYAFGVYRSNPAIDVRRWPRLLLLIAFTNLIFGITPRLIIWMPGSPIRSAMIKQYTSLTDGQLARNQLAGPFWLHYDTPTSANVGPGWQVKLIEITPSSVPLSEMKVKFVYWRDFSGVD